MKLKVAGLNFLRITHTPPDNCSECGDKGELLPRGNVCLCCRYYKPELVRETV